MDTCLENGAHKLSDLGKPYSIDGTDELIQRALIRLLVKKGSLRRNPEFGSLFYQLGNYSGNSLENLALGYAVDALGPMPEILVERVMCKHTEPNAMVIEVSLKINNDFYKLEVFV